jgi:hypothetical protein
MSDANDDRQSQDDPLLRGSCECHATVLASFVGFQPAITSSR